MPPDEPLGYALLDASGAVDGQPEISGHALSELAVTEWVELPLKE